MHSGRCPFFIENVMTRVNHETQPPQKELTEKTDKKQVELRAAEVFLENPWPNERG
jgi:hypothetical protein